MTKTAINVPGNEGIGDLAKAAELHVKLSEGDEMAVMLDPQGMSFAVWRRAG